MKERTSTRTQAVASETPFSLMGINQQIQRLPQRIDAQANEMLQQNIWGFILLIYNMLQQQMLFTAQYSARFLAPQTGSKEDRGRIQTKLPMQASFLQATAHKTSCLLPAETKTTPWASQLHMPSFLQDPRLSFSSNELITLHLCCTELIHLLHP